MKRVSGAVLLAAFALLCSASARAQEQGQNQSQNQQQKPSLGGATQGSQTGQSGQAGQAAAPARQLTPEERKAYLAIQNELDPDRQLQLVEGFAKKYPDSPLLSDVYFFGSYASQQKNNMPQVIDYGTKSLKANPDNLRSLLTMATILPQPQNMQGSDADKDQKLNDAEADANKALQRIGDLKQQPNQTPDQLAALKAGLTGQVHAALGMVHLQRAMMGLTGADPQELGKAEVEYKTAVSASSHPNPEDYYRLGEIYRNEGKVDDAIDAFGKASQLSQGSPLQAIADQQVQGLKAKKAQSPPPAKP